MTINFFIYLFTFSGETRGRFKASNKKPYPNKKDCYYATLTISKMISGDARFYTATIANERGRSEYDIHVRVIRISCYTNLPIFFAYFSMFLLK